MRGRVDIVVLRLRIALGVETVGLVKNVPLDSALAEWMVGVSVDHFADPELSANMRAQVRKPSPGMAVSSV